MSKELNDVIFSIREQKCQKKTILNLIDSFSLELDYKCKKVRMVDSWQQLYISFQRNKPNDEFGNVLKKLRNQVHSYPNHVKNKGKSSVPCELEKVICNLSCSNLKQKSKNNDPSRRKRI